MAGARSGRGALPVTATVLADRHAFGVGPLHPGLELVSGPAFAHVGRHAFAVHASVRTDRLALPVHLLVAQFASAHVGREAVGVLLAGLLAEGHAYAARRDPSWRTAAHVRPRALSAHASLAADRVAGAGARVPLVPVATIQNRNPPTFLRGTREERRGKREKG